MSWRLIDPLRNEFCGEITPLMPSEAKKLGKGWFKWANYMSREDKSHMNVYKLKRTGYADVLGIISLCYSDGVYIDSLEIAPHSRRMPNHQRRYVNLCDVMLAFAAYWGVNHYNDGFIGLIPKTGLQAHYVNKYRAYPLNLGIYAIDTPVTSQLIRLYLY